MPDVSLSKPDVSPPAMTTIDDVLVRLNFIIDTARRRGSADGYFAALYRRVTETVKIRIAQGAFTDGPRMANSTSRSPAAMSMHGISMNVARRPRQRGR